MRLITYKKDGIVKLGVLSANNGVIDISTAGIDKKDMNDLIITLTHTERQILEDLSSKSGGEPYESIEKLPPILSPLQDIICLGINYMEHAKESYRFKKIEFDGKREFPVYFGKRANYILGDGAKFPSHSNITQTLDYEVELALIIGKDAYNVSIKDALEYVFGYTILNDISSRDIQNRYKQWYYGKSLDGSTLMGPWIETNLDISNLKICSRINGELRQNANTADMIFDAAYVISDLSAGMTLKAGTIISLGTPSGVGMGFTPPKYLKKDDIVECEIEGIGILKNIVGE
ncbi:MULTISPECIES: fumarylacetoacetate hydrolase family protein [Campylobacter]|uniref:fumarylacetoacetate hydrolase family protein n=1 Tax=Campylobacter TaxID=194 RepID=UPI00254C4190|nr:MULTISPECIES: fumarylacetoacetate hydrolase family protein [Campylobacter]MBQ8609903.1 fumarylacetoacetate hydrolase family protein [Campylobacter sp.]MBQ8819224.1 fumarylacetoacetate hydrolase family protein [Campylobacter sp.]MDL0104956.1 fumarylacetoacetate hydrolase family protein [Campylobacter ovis]MDL0107122.1 fumarylacetoacetate hydrolase family protein [Campylobacter ovis]